MRAFNLAKEQQLSVHEQKTIEKLLSLISVEEAYSMTEWPVHSVSGPIQGATGHLI